MPNPPDFIKHLRDERYHPRSNKHSNALAECIVGDLLRSCASMAQKAAEGKLVCDLNNTIMVNNTDWNIDLVFGTPALGESIAPTPPSLIRRAMPATILVAIELKAVMTEHHKAVRNRKRDFEAHHSHVHAYKQGAFAGGVLLINGSERFKSPTRAADDITTHRNHMAQVEHCVAEMRAVATRPGPSGIGLDGKAAIVVDCDNMNPETFRYVTGKPAPQLGDPMYYDAFIQGICNYFTRYLLPDCQ